MRYLPIGIILLLALVTSCGNFRKIERSEDWRIKYEASLRYYESEDYYKASVLFEQIMPVVRGLPEGEKVQFYLAYCQFYQKYYLLASEQFRTFAETYGRSAFAEEARFMFAYSLFEAAPGHELDQTSGVESMSYLQEFLNRYPNSQFRDRAIEAITISQLRLEEKGFANAYQYYKMRYYKAAITALNNFKNNFPDSKYVEEAYFLVVDAEYRLAEQSIPSKKAERYKAVVDHYKEFLERYPESKFLKNAEQMYASSLVKMKSKNL